MSKEPFDRPECGDQRRPFTGWFISIDVIRLFDARTINLKETILLAIISNYSKTEKGCYMSNERLGRELAVSGSHVSDMISNLKSLKLVSETGFDGRTRQLKVLDFSEAESPKTRRQHPEKSGGSIRKNPYHKDKEESKAKERAKALSGESEKPNSRKGKQPSSFDHKAAAQLRKVVSSHIKVNENASMREWANSFRLLRERDGVPADEIKKAIKWYKHYIGEEYIPEAFSAKTFREKYSNGQIPSAMRKTEDESGGNGNGNGKIDALDILNNLQILGTSLDPDQEDIDDAAAMLGVSAGTFTVKDVIK